MVTLRIELALFGSGFAYDRGSSIDKCPSVCVHLLMESQTSAASTAAAVPAIFPRTAGRPMFSLPWQSRRDSGMPVM